MMDGVAFVFVAGFDSEGQPEILHRGDSDGRMAGYLGNRAATPLGIAGEGHDEGADDGVLRRRLRLVVALHG